MNDENTKVVDEKEGEDEKENQEIISFTNFHFHSIINI